MAVPQCLSLYQAHESLLEALTAEIPVGLLVRTVTWLEPQQARLGKHSRVRSPRGLELIMVHLYGLGALLPKQNQEFPEIMKSNKF